MCLFSLCNFIFLCDIELSFQFSTYFPSQNSKTKSKKLKKQSSWIPTKKFKFDGGETTNQVKNEWKKFNVLAEEEIIEQDVDQSVVSGSSKRSQGAEGNDCGLWFDTKLVSTTYMTKNVPDDAPLGLSVFY